MEFTTQKTITCKWWNEESKNVSPENLEVLENEGYNRALEMMGQGFTAGELIAEIEIEGFSKAFNGWWEINTITL